MTQLLARPPTPTLDASRTAFTSDRQTDEELMVLIQAHCQSGLNALHHRYSALLKGIGMNTLHNGSDAEDLLQDVFVEIWNRASLYDPLMGRPLAWISTIARRRSIDHLRKRQVRSLGEERSTEQSQFCEVSWTHVHEDLARNETNKLLDGALATLPEPQRHVIGLAFDRQMSQREIRTHTGIPLGTVKTRLELGLRKMAVSLCKFKDLVGPARRSIRAARA